MAAPRRNGNQVQTPADDTEFVDYSTLPASPTLPAWAVITAALVLVAVVAFFAIAIITERQQFDRNVSEYACGLTFERYTTQWQNCVDDR